jgi:hypothetical protein
VEYVLVWIGAVMLLPFPLLAVLFALDESGR